MFRHIVTLLWNRRRASRLVIIEIAAAFLVTFVVCALSLHAWGNYRRPLGFNYENIWQVSVTNEALGAQSGNSPDALRKSMEDILAALRQLPGVRGAHAIAQTPFADGLSFAMLGREGAPTPTMTNVLSAGAVRDLGLRVVQGRGFGPEDDGQDYYAALVNRDFVDTAYAGASPVGKRINFIPAGNAEIRVVGIIEDFRQNGEFSEKTPYVILLERPGGAVSTNLLVKVAPGTERRLEEQMVAAVAGAASGFNATITPWAEMRASRNLEAMLPLRIGATIALFLLAMVALGLIGIVWQDVLLRTREIGLRRAAGASANKVRAQIVLEVLVIGSAGILIGTLFAIQVPLLSIVQQINWAAALPALVLSALLILMLAACAALYPALLASARQPADTLRYE